MKKDENIIKKIVSTMNNTNNFVKLTINKKVVYNYFFNKKEGLYLINNFNFLLSLRWEEILSR